MTDTLSGNAYAAGLVRAEQYASIWADAGPNANDANVFKLRIAQAIGHEPSYVLAATIDCLLFRECVDASEVANLCRTIIAHGH